MERNGPILVRFKVRQGQQVRKVLWAQPERRATPGLRARREQPGRRELRGPPGLRDRKVQLGRRARPGLQAPPVPLV